MKIVTDSRINKSTAELTVQLDHVSEVAEQALNLAKQTIRISLITGGISIVLSLAALIASLYSR